MDNNKVTSLEGLTRYSHDKLWTGCMTQGAAGEYVKFADVERLLATMAAAAEPVAIPAGWISVQERLPEDRTRVLGARAGLGYVTEVFHGGQSSIAGSTQKTWRLNDCSFREPVIEGITHWMPLPAAPSASSASPVVASNQGEQA